MDNRTTFEILFATIAVLTISYLVELKHPAPWIPAAPVDSLTQVDKTTITPPSVEVYAPAAKKKLGLPANPDTHVIGAASVPSSQHDHTVVTVIDAKTGKSETITRVEPDPWLAKTESGSARIDYGVRTGYGTVARLSVQQDVFQVKALHFGVAGSLDSDGTLFAGVGVVWRW